MVCGDFNADLASDVALCDLLSEQGLLLAWRSGDVNDWVGRKLWGNVFCCSLFLGLKGSFTYLFVWTKHDERCTFFRCIDWFLSHDVAQVSHTNQRPGWLVCCQLKSKSKRILDLVETKVRC